MEFIRGWQIDYPGSMGTGPCLVNNYLDLPKDVCNEVQDWQDYYDRDAQPWRAEGDPMDYDVLHEWGLRVTKEVRRFVPPDYYIEYNLFQELVIAGNEVIEKEVPEYLRNLAKLDQIHG